MSKAVSGVGNAIGGVLKGAVNLVKDVGNGIGRIVKDIGSSKIGKAILIAGAIYFGGAALSGGFGASAGGGSFFSGMSAGVSNAAASLQSAWTSAMAGEFSQAGSTLANSWGTANNAGYMTSPNYLSTVGEAVVPITETAAATVPEVAAPAPEIATTLETSSANTVTGTPLNSADVIAKAPTDSRFITDLSAPTNQYSLGSNVSNPGLNLSNSGAGFNAGGYSIPYNSVGSTTLSSILNSPYTAPALISGGMQVGGAYIQGQAQEKQLREQREYEARMVEEARNRYNTNVGAELWDPNAQAPIYQAQGPAFDPYAEARARAAQVYAPAQTGLAAKYMNA
jgi:hypothetical protein